MTIQILLSAAFLIAVLWLGFRVPVAEGGAPQRRTRLHCQCRRCSSPARAREPNAFCRSPS